MTSKLISEPRTPSTVHIIAGPTASGKSATALELAQALNGVIVNCDSLQIYDALPLLTAQPDAQEKARAPHVLYGALHPNDVCSAGNWRELAIPVIEGILARGQTPIVCGGTGLYIRALMEGLSPIPDIPDVVRSAVVARYEAVGAEAFYDELQRRDPIMAARFHANHKARIIRAMEVLEATGISLAQWQELPASGPPHGWTFEIHKITPDRETRRARCDLRFDWMMENGALEEVEAFQARIESGEVNEGTPITKALGFQPLRAYLKGQMSKEEAVERAKFDTKYYAKRQSTWFRHQL